MSFCVSKKGEKSRLRKKESVDSVEGLAVQRDWREIFFRYTPSGLHFILYYSIISLIAMYLLTHSLQKTDRAWNDSHNGIVNRYARWLITQTKSQRTPRLTAA